MSALSIKNDWLLCVLIMAQTACTKSVGRDPSLAYGDKALFDSCTKPHHYYRNSSALLPAKGPHGLHTFRLNSIAMAALDSSFRLPKGRSMPEGAMVIKDSYDGGDPVIYSFMYKHSGAWIWGEYKTNKEMIHSRNSPSSVCTGCHGGQGNSDFILGFY